jgi:hypothetical protein
MLVTDVTKPAMASCELFTDVLVWQSMLRQQIVESDLAADVIIPVVQCHLFKQELSVEGKT